MRHAHITKPRPATPPPITARSLARGSATTTSLIRPPPAPVPAKLEVARAIEILYAVGERDMVVGAAADLGDRSNEFVGTLAAIGVVLPAGNNDARAMLLLGKAALGRGLPLEAYAFPTIGMPNYTARSVRRSKSRSSMPSHGRKAHSVKRSSPAPGPWA